MGMSANAVDHGFWRGKRVFLTGHTGFKGGWISLWLQAMGASVTGFSLSPPTDPSLFDVATVWQGMESHIGDIRDYSELEKRMKVADPEIVIHMAAQPLVRQSYIDPVETYSTNVMGTVNVLQAIRKLPNVRAVLVITTDKCYENKEWLWGYRENEPLGGYDPYSNSKGCAELVTAAFRSSFFNPEQYASHGVAVASARAGNVIGGGDWARDRLIPDILRACSEGKSVVIRRPDAIRPWQHVLEPLRGYLKLAERLYAQGTAFAEGWNFGPRDDDARPVEWVVDKLVTIWGDGATWTLDKDAHPHEATYLKLDISKARSRLNWTPALCLQDALSLTVDWAKAYRSGNDMRTFTQRQIIAYEDLLA